MTIQVASTSTNRQWVLAARPVDRAVHESDFRLIDAPVPMPGRGEFLVRTAQWIAEGRMRYLEDVLEGFEQMPRALMRLYSGQNTGKQLVRIDPTAR